MRSVAKMMVTVVYTDNGRDKLHEEVSNVMTATKKTVAGAVASYRGTASTSSLVMKIPLIGRV